MRTIACALLLAGCASSQWVNPYKPVQAFELDQASCTQSALAQYPPVLIDPNPAVPPSAPSTTTCTTSAYGDTRCTTRTNSLDTSLPLQVRQPVYDANAATRSESVAVCLSANGWQRSPTR